MISPTGNIYCDFCGREQAECGPVTANDGMDGRCHASAVATQEAMDEDSNVLHGRTAHESTVAIRKPAGAGNGYRICADCALRSIASRLGKTEKTLPQHPQSEDCPYREEENCATHHHSCQICWRTIPR